MMPPPKRPKAGLAWVNELISDVGSTGKSYTTVTEASQTDSNVSASTVSNISPMSEPRSSSISPRTSTFMSPSSPPMSCAQTTVTTSVMPISPVTTSVMLTSPVTTSVVVSTSPSAPMLTTASMLRSTSTSLCTVISDRTTSQSSSPLSISQSPVTDQQVTMVDSPLSLSQSPVTDQQVTMVDSPLSISQSPVTDQQVTMVDSPLSLSQSPVTDQQVTMVDSPLSLSQSPVTDQQVTMVDIEKDVLEEESSHECLDDRTVTDCARALSPSISLSIEQLGKNTNSQDSPNSQECNSESPNSQDCNSESPNSQDCNSESPNSKECNSESPNSKECISESPNSKECNSESPNSKECNSESPNSQAIESSYSMCSSDSMKENKEPQNQTSLLVKPDKIASRGRTSEPESKKEEFVLPNQPMLVSLLTEEVCPDYILDTMKVGLNFNSESHNNISHSGNSEKESVASPFLRRVWNCNDKSSPHESGKLMSQPISFHQGYNIFYGPMDQVKFGRSNIQAGQHVRNTECQSSSEPICISPEPDLEVQTETCRDYHSNQKPINFGQLTGESKDKCVVQSFKSRFDGSDQLPPERSSQAVVTDDKQRAMWPRAPCKKTSSLDSGLHKVTSGDRVQMEPSSFQSLPPALLPFSERPFISAFQGVNNRIMGAFNQVCPSGDICSPAQDKPLNLALDKYHTNGLWQKPAFIQNRQEIHCQTPNQHSERIQFLAQKGTHLEKTENFGYRHPTSATGWSGSRPQTEYCFTRVDKRIPNGNRSPNYGIPPRMTREVTQPMLSTREVTQPMLSTREVTQPMLSTREVTQPMLSTREVTQPMLSTREVTQPMLSTREATQPMLISMNQRDAGSDIFPSDNMHHGHDGSQLPGEHATNRADNHYDLFYPNQMKTMSVSGCINSIVMSTLLQNQVPQYPIHDGNYISHPKNIVDDQSMKYGNPQTEVPPGEHKPNPAALAHAMNQYKMSSIGEKGGNQLGRHHVLPPEEYIHEMSVSPVLSPGEYEQKHNMSPREKHATSTMLPPGKHTEKHRTSTMLPPGEYVEKHIANTMLPLLYRYVGKCFYDFIKVST